LIQLNHRDLPGLQEIVGRINSSVKRGSRLVDGLLHFSRKQISKEFQAVDLVSVIQETSQIAKTSFNSRLRLELDLPERLSVMGDSAGISQVIMNLCTNARDAMPQGGRLRIEAHRQPPFAVVRVSDTGIGMDRETLEKCFDPFFTTKPIGRGTGLGLSTAYGIIKSHNGAINVESRPGEGSSFRLQFPLAKTDQESNGDEARSLIQGHGECVLLVDDEADILRALQGLLKNLNYRPLFAETGDEAVKLYNSWRPDVVLLDVNMPGMDGLECARRLFEIDPEARIVIFSGYEPPQERLPDLLNDKLLKGYLTKPADIFELSRLLSDVLADKQDRSAQPERARTEGIKQRFDPTGSAG
jgi:CheY-like chemotaxis protein/two-component sensor histidine kinase